MAFTKIVPAGINTGGSYTLQNLDVVGVLTASSFSGPLTGDATGLTGTPNITVGVITASSAVISGDLTVNGTTTTLDTLLTEVDKLEVGANNTNVAVAITQSGSGDILRLYDGATQVVTVKDGGSVGIGTDNPNYLFHLFNSGQNNIALFESGDAFASFGLSDSNGSVSFRTTLGTLQIRTGGDAGTVGTNGIESLVIKSTGEVGIGTDTPTEKLDVRGDLVVAESIAANRPRIILSAPNDGTTYRHLFGANLQVNSSGTFTTPTANISGGGWEYLPANALNNHGSLRYISAPDTNSTSSTPVERLRISSSGNVGIGTDNPQHKLNVYNETASSTGGILVQNVTYTANEDRPYLIVGTKNWTGATTNWNTYGFQHRMKANSGGTPRITIDTFNGEVFCVDNSGNVGIGTDTPYSNNSFNSLSVGGSGKYGLIELVKSNGVAGSWIDSYGTNGDGNLRFTTAGTSGAITFWTGGEFTEKLRITSGGLVGIGTNNPSVILDVRETKTAGSTQIRLYNTDNSNTTTQTAEVSLTPDSRALAGVGIKAFKENADFSTNANRDISLALNVVQNNSQNEALRITSTGNVGIGTATPRDKLDVGGGSICKTGTGSNYRPHMIVRDSNGRIRYFEYYFSCSKGASLGTAIDQYILDITNIGSFFQASFEVVYGTRLQSVSDATTSTCHKTFGVNRFNSGNVAITDINSIEVDSNSNTHADLRMDALSSSGVRLKVAFSNSLGGSSFCSGVLRAWGVSDALEHESYQTLTFYNGM